MVRYHEYVRPPPAANAVKAAVLRAFGEPLTFENLPDPEPGDGEVVIDVAACGVCHSDVHLADGDWDLMRPITKLPLVLGHEVTGVVAALGTGVTRLRVGDRVGVPWLHWTCGECEWCRAGQETLCLKQAITGATVDGGYATRMKARASHVARLPDALGFTEAAPLLCAGLTVHRALKKSGLGAGERLVVFGAGGLGHLAIQLGKAAGAEVIAVDVAADKLRLASESGADRVIDAGSGDTSRVIRKLGGAHVALVVSGSVAAYEAALRSVRRGGVLVAVGMPASPVPVSIVGLVAGEIRIIASAVGTRQDLREVLDLAAAGRVHCRCEERPLDQVNETMAGLRSGVVTGRIVLRP